MRVSFTHNSTFLKLLPQQFVIFNLAYQMKIAEKETTLGIERVRVYSTSTFCFSWTSPGLEKGNIRLVLFRDHDLKGRKLVFDSAAVHKAVEPQKVEILTASRN